MVFSCPVPGFQACSNKFIVHRNKRFVPIQGHLVFQVMAAKSASYHISQVRIKLIAKPEACVEGGDECESVFYRNGYGNGCVRCQERGVFFVMCQVVCIRERSLP